MKCPKCGTELTGKEICRQCGAKTENQIEVEYKDFRISELLEIRHSKLRQHQKQEEKQMPGARNVLPANGINTLSGAAEKTVRKKDSTRKTYIKNPPLYSDKKSFTKTIIFVLLMVIFTAGVFFVWRFLF